MKSALYVNLNDLDTTSPGAVECPDCGWCLTLHQPTITRPDRLLATCDECESWFLTTDGCGTLERLPISDPPTD
jgi:hypothetical protein